MERLIVQSRLERFSLEESTKTTMISLCYTSSSSLMSLCSTSASSYCTEEDMVMCDWDPRPSSYFDDILPIEIIRMILGFIDDVKTFGTAIQVNKLWYQEVHIAWRNFCQTRYFYIAIEYSCERV